MRATIYSTEEESGGKTCPPRLEVDDQRQTIPKTRGPGRRKRARKAQEGENPPPTEGQMPPETTTSPNMAQKVARAEENCRTEQEKCVEKPPTPPPPARMQEVTTRDLNISESSPVLT